MVSRPVSPGFSIEEGVDHAFNLFFKQLKSDNPEVSFSTESVKNLVYRYWQHLNKNDEGRISLWVQGPSGWGKDFILDKTLNLWQQQQPITAKKTYRHINANLNQLSILMDAVNEAATEGFPLAISGIKSAYKQ